MKISNSFLRRALHMPFSTKELQAMKKSADSFASHVTKVSNSPWTLHQLKITAEYTLNGHNTEKGTKNEAKKTTLKELLKALENHGLDKNKPSPPINNLDMSRSDKEWDELEVFLNDDRESSIYDSHYPKDQDKSMRRFADILANKNTLSNDLCQINNMKVKDTSAGFACAYPRNDKLLDYFDHLLTSNVEMINIISSEEDLNKHKTKDAGMTRYFEPTSENDPMVKLPEGVEIPDNCHVRSTLIESKSTGDITHKIYKLNIKMDDQKKEMIVIHTDNWLDMTAISPEELDSIVALRQSYASLDKSLTHCTAGVGRTGCLVAAQHMTENSSSTLEETVLGLRLTRNRKMVQTPSQVKLMVDWAKARTRKDHSESTPVSIEPIYMNVNLSS